MAEKFLRVTMSDESQWEVPARLIVEDRARAMAEDDTGTTSGDEYERIRLEEIDYALDDSSEIIDWAANNMNWADVAGVATMTRPPAVDYQEGWVNGEHEVIERDHDPAAAPGAGSGEEV